MSSLQAWAGEITKDAYKLNEKLEWKEGFETFFSPVKPEPDLLVLSLQPSGDEGDYTADRIHYQNAAPESIQEFLPPTKNEYATEDWIFAKRMRKLMPLDRLDGSVAMPIVFFRKKNYPTWQEEAKNKRILIEAEVFCFDAVSKIIAKLHPKSILVIGKNTYWHLWHDVFHSEPRNERVLPIVTENKDGKKKTWKVIHSECGGYNTLAIDHITGTRGLSGDWFNKVGSKIDELL